MDLALLEPLLDHLPVRVVVIGLDHRYHYANRAVLDFLGLARPELVGRSIAEVRGEAVFQRYLAAVPHLLAGDELRWEGWTDYPGRGRCFTEELLLPQRGTDGQVAQLIGYARDLTAVKEQEETLRQQLEALQRAEQLKAAVEAQREALRQSEKLSAMGGLLAGVAHELNNPLAIVMGRAALLQDKAAGTPLHDDAARIHEAAARCGRIVRTFLDMARQRPARRVPVQLNELVRGAAELLQYGLRASGIALELQLDDTLPALDADPDRLGQLVLNLMVNAQQALESAPVPAAGSASRRLRVATGHGRGGRGATGNAACAWLQVEDNGPGVPAEAREHIFDPYFTTKGEGLGTGLGLSVARSVAREHGGELTLEDGAGGALFRLELPLSVPAAATAPPLAATQDDAAPTRRVLVVDDEPEIVDLLRAMLEGAGYEVAAAESGMVALELLAEARFDAIVSDLRMPGMDGAALWREVRARDAALAQRMLFVTGDTLSPGAQRFLDDAGCGSLDKPFAKGELLARVKELVERAA